MIDIGADVVGVEECSLSWSPSDHNNIALDKRTEENTIPLVLKIIVLLGGKENVLHRRDINPNNVLHLISAQWRHALLDYVLELF